MPSKLEDQLQSLEDLYNHPGRIGKACSIGVIIDSTNNFYDENHKQYVKKIKVIDSTLNPNRCLIGQKFGYVTVFFYAFKPEDLPNPRYIGDLIYLRRFAFEKYEDNFQAKTNLGTYCNWALIDGDISNKATAEYQTSRADINLNDEKYQNLPLAIKELRQFSREYLEQNTILGTLPIGITPKDNDYIVQIVKKNEEGDVRVRRGKEEWILNEHATFANEGDIAKLRSVSRVNQPDQRGFRHVVPNNFTSLVPLRNWSFDAQRILNQGQMDIEEPDELIFTSLAELNALPLNACENKIYYLKVEVAGLSANDFSSAVKYYDEKKRTLSDSQVKNTVPIYKVSLQCLDESTNNKIQDIWLFSYDGKGGDFLNRVRLDELNQYSTLNQENLYFKERAEDLLNRESVRMTVEVLSDGKSGRLLRALNIN